MTPTEMYTKFGKTLGKLLKSRGVAEEDEEFVQECWVRLFEKAPHVRGTDASSQHFFWVCATRVIIDVQRHRERLVHLDSMQEVQESDLRVEPLTEGFPMPEAKNPATQVQYGIMAKMLSEGYYENEIARCLGVSACRAFLIAHELRNNGQPYYGVRKAA